MLILTRSVRKSISRVSRSQTLELPLRFVHHYPLAIFFDAKKTAAKETVAVENFINQRHRFRNDFNSSARRRFQTENHSTPALFLDFTDKISQGDK